jgi:hypothetical protein
MNRQGVDYDVGRVLEGTLMRPTFDAKVVHRELEIIKNDLHCNAVRIQGFDIDRLMVAAEDALKQGLEVWFSPEMFEKSQQETFDYVVKCAAKAETLRRQWPRLVFSIGSELTLFMQGFVEGNTLLERMNNPSFWENIKAGKHNKSLNAFLAKTNKAVRQVFHGKITYFSVPLETVDWSLFDFVGVDLYRDARIRGDAYTKLVKSYFVHSKPVIIGEFGCCTYQGAEKLGGMGWAITFGMLSNYLNFDKKSLPKTIVDIIEIPVQLDGHYIRDEGLQAWELTDQLHILDNVGVDGTFVFTFVSPTTPFNEDPKFDFDMASYSLVKSYADKHGTTYPDMSWEPKESFKAVADYYAKLT